MKMLFGRFVKDESGATAIEYGIISAGIVPAIIPVTVVEGLFGDDIDGAFGPLITDHNPVPDAGGFPVRDALVTLHKLWSGPASITGGYW